LDAGDRDDGPSNLAVASRIKRITIAFDYPVFSPTTASPRDEIRVRNLERLFQAFGRAPDSRAGIAKTTGIDSQWRCAIQTLIFAGLAARASCRRDAQLRTGLKIKTPLRDPRAARVFPTHEIIL
jgi:hypothetical protein